MLYSTYNREHTVCWLLGAKQVAHGWLHFVQHLVRTRSNCESHDVQPCVCCHMQNIMVQMSSARRIGC
jgi:hypothetical protein